MGVSNPGYVVYTIYGKIRSCIERLDIAGAQPIISCILELQHMVMAVGCTACIAT